MYKLESNKEEQEYKKKQAKHYRAKKARPDHELALELDNGTRKHNDGRQCLKTLPRPELNKATPAPDVALDKIQRKYTTECRCLKTIADTPQASRIR